MSVAHPSRLSARRWRRVRELVLMRDLGVCRRCGRPGATTAGHIVPVALGGAPFDPANLAAEHARCNYRAGARVELPRAPFAPRW